MNKLKPVDVASAADAQSLLNVWLGVESATHYLVCTHAIGRNRRSYLMRCILLKRCGAGNAKVIVFGERGYVDTEHIKRVRYVPFGRLHPLIPNVKLRGAALLRRPSRTQG